MEEDRDYEVDHEVDDTVEVPATLEVKQESKPQTEPMVVPKRGEYSDLSDSDLDIKPEPKVERKRGEYSDLSNSDTDLKPEPKPEPKVEIKRGEYSDLSNSDTDLKPEPKVERKRGEYSDLSNSDTDLKPEPKPEPQVERKRGEYSDLSNSDTDLKPEPKPLEPKVETKRGEYSDLSNSDTDIKPEPKPEPKVETKRGEYSDLSNSDTDLKPEPKVERKRGEYSDLSNSDTDLKPEPKPEPKVETKRGEYSDLSNSETDLKPEPKPLEPKEKKWSDLSDSDPNIKPEPKPLELKPKKWSDSESEPERKTKPKRKISLKPKPKNWSDSESEPEPKPRSKPEPEPELKPEPEPQPEPEPELEPEPKLWTEAEAEQGMQPFEWGDSEPEQVPEQEQEIVPFEWGEPEPEPEPQPVEEVDIADQLEQLEIKQRKASKKRPGSCWKRPPTFVYANNFGFGVNIYQTMIDYLDAKDAGRLVVKDVHLPLLEERCLRQYEANKPFKYYTNQDIDQYIMKGEKIRTQIRQNDARGASNVLRRTHTNWSMTRKWVQLVKNSHVLDYRKLHTTGRELDDRSYRSPTPVGGSFYLSRTPTPVKALDYHSPALTPKTSYLDDLSTGIASVVLSLVQRGMENAQRRERIQELDDRYEDTMDQVNEHVRRIGGYRAETPPSHRRLGLSDLDQGARNKIRRSEEMRDMVDYVNDLTRLNSARNTLRSNMRGSGMDRDLMHLGSRVDDMKKLQQAERMRDTSSDYEIDLLRAEIAARRGMSRAPSLFGDDPTYMMRASSRARSPQPFVLPPVDPNNYRIRDSLSREDLISDVCARVYKRASEFGDPSSEQRRINNRARYVNTVAPRLDTGDTYHLVAPSRTERNIDYMAKTLASGGAFQRRYAIDDELELPYASVTSPRQDYLGLGTFDPIEQHPSNSSKVRHATSRARVRSSLLGY